MFFYKKIALKMFFVWINYFEVSVLVLKELGENKLIWPGIVFWKGDTGVNKLPVFKEFVLGSLKEGKE